MPSTDGANGTITDGSGSNIYLDNTNCGWLIYAQSDSVILEFTSFDIEDGYDYVTIHNGGTINTPIIARLTGTMDVPFTIGGRAGQPIFIHFTSDYGNGQQGFEVSPC